MKNEVTELYILKKPSDLSKGLEFKNNINQLFKKSSN